MRKIGNLIIIIVFMFLIAAISLMLVAAFSYLYKWQADKALIGITVTYILAGFSGGLMQNRWNRGNKTIGKKMAEGIALGTVFMAIIVLMAVFALESSVAVSTRFLMLWMLVAGSTCLGHIL